VLALDGASFLPLLLAVLVLPASAGRHDTEPRRRDPRSGLAVLRSRPGVAGLLALTLAIDREPLTRRFLVCLPLLLFGVVLTAGVVDGGAGGTDPLLGMVHAVLAALCYSGFLFLLRRGGRGGQVVQPYVVVLIAAVVVSLLAGFLWQGVELAPGWGALGWLALAALSSQVVGWLLVALASPWLPSGPATTPGTLQGVSHARRELTPGRGRGPRGPSRS
jgi:drug/metabolite transporter (DMT)-like permease